MSNCRQPDEVLKTTYTQCTDQLSFSAPSHWSTHAHEKSFLNIEPKLNLHLYHPQL